MNPYANQEKGSHELTRMGTNIHLRNGAFNSRRTGFIGVHSCSFVALFPAAILVAFLALLPGCAEYGGSAGSGSAPAKLLVSGIATSAPATQPVDPAWRDLDRIMQRHGVAKNGVYVFTIPRDDLDVAIEGMGVPAAAGIESVFYFYRCPCGKMNVAGQFVTTDYEADDVVDALRKNATLKVATIAPFLLYAKPTLMLVRFQGEGDPVEMAKNLREALSWTGKERLAPWPTTNPVR